MTPERLQALAATYTQNREFITNEESTKMVLVVPFIKLLGFDPGVPREVRLEYSADFTQGDGKKFTDRMDFAIFDPTGSKALIVIEVKPLGTDLKAKAQQLARYIGQMPGLHFGVMTDGNRYLFYGDLDQPNVMDAAPFFSFSLDDPKADWNRICTFLQKFSRDSFNPETLIIDAENNRFRLAMTDRLAKALLNPDADEAFVRWLTEGVYTGKRTSNVMQRLNVLAREVIEPSMMHALSEDFLSGLRSRLSVPSTAVSIPAPGLELLSVPATSGSPEKAVLARQRRSRSRDIVIAQTLVSPIATAMDEIPPTAADAAFLAWVKQLLHRRAISESTLKTRNYSRYFSLTLKSDDQWFVRYFCGVRKRYLYTILTPDEVMKLIPGARVFETHSAHGRSRIELGVHDDLTPYGEVVLRSIEIRESAR